MKEWMKEWGWAILLATGVVSSIVLTKDPDEVGRLRRAERNIADIRPAYDTAMRIGDFQRACHEAILMNQYATDSYNSEFAKPYFDMKVEACRK